MDLELKDRIAVVTGASKGIGLAVVRALAAEGALVVAGARTTGGLDGMDRVRAVGVDLATPDGPGRLVQRALDEFGRVDVLVNNVGAVKIRLQGFLGTTDDDFERSMQVNFFSAVRATRAALGPMVRQGKGAIVNIASVNAFFQPDGLVLDYGAAKAALVNVAKALSQELGPHGIRINSVSPGPVATDLWLGAGGVAESGGDPAAEAAKAATGRFTEPEEVADLVVLLASERAGNVTGADFLIDGGLITTL
jgi:NAD(P)-dependent dehydrogenase (short-subunit alcohol dehydrogenase family)